MIEIIGKYDTAKIFTDNIEEQAISQLYKILNSKSAEDSHIRIMPDCHAGAGCVIGTTMKITDKVVPYFIGVDIGCGMLVQKLKDTHIVLEKLDKVIHKNVPSGFNIHNKAHRWASNVRLDELLCKDHLPNKHKFPLAIGTLGGGNHFIEINKDDEDNFYLVIHTGSRNLGKQIADYYQQKAYKDHESRRVVGLRNILEALRESGRIGDIEQVSKYYVDNNPTIDKAMAYCEGQLMDDYLHDMAIAQEYATLNRMAIADIIQCGMRWKVASGDYDNTNRYYAEFQTIHNYIDMDTKILRKGAVSAKKDEMLIIPMNMRDGSLICVGKGNEDWNNSAPHGAGRIMSRKKAKESVSMDDYRNSMNGIYTTCVDKSTIDESPMVYKPMQEIIDNIGDTVDIVKMIKPVYNFKAGGE